MDMAKFACRTHMSVQQLQDRTEHKTAHSSTQSDTEHTLGATVTLTSAIAHTKPIEHSGQPASRLQFGLVAHWSSKKYIVGDGQVNRVCPELHSCIFVLHVLHLLLLNLIDLDSDLQRSHLHHQHCILR